MKFTTVLALLPLAVVATPASTNFQPQDVCVAGGLLPSWSYSYECPSLNCGQHGGQKFYPGTRFIVSCYSNWGTNVRGSRVWYKSIYGGWLPKNYINPTKCQAPERVVRQC